MKTLGELKLWAIASPCPQGVQRIDSGPGSRYTVNVSWQTDTHLPHEQEVSGPEEQGGQTISQLVQTTGLSARTLRYYEELGLLPGIRRRSSGRRVYGEDEVQRLRFIQRLKALGLSLSEIKELNAVYAIQGSTDAMLKRLASLLDAHLSELDGRIAELQGLRSEMGRYRDRVAQPENPPEALKNAEPFAPAEDRTGSESVE